MHILLSPGAKLGYRIGMVPGESPVLSKLRANFEDRQAIYVEKGAVLVRVSDIRRTRTMISAQIDELPAPGLGVGMFSASGPTRPAPRRWTIRAGAESGFTGHCWNMGYGGWSLYFDPRLVQASLALASAFPDTLDTSERYRQIVFLLQQDQFLLAGQWQRVFPAA